MPANDFEKQAKQLLDELNIRPDEQVWVEVEKRIREKKRRRWIIIFPILAGLLIGGYYTTQYYTGAGNKNNIAVVTKNENGKQAAVDGKENQEKNEAVKPEIKSEEIIAVTKDNNTEQQDLIKKKEDAIVKAADSKEKITENEKLQIAIAPVIKVKEQHIKGLLVNASSKRKSVKPVTNAILPVNNKVTDSKAENPTDVNDVVINKTTESIAGKTETEPVATQSSENKITSNDDKTAAAQNVEAEKKEPTQPVITTEAEKKATENKTEVKPKIAAAKTKWKPGVMFAVGVSNISNKLLSLDLAKNNEEKALDYLATGGAPNVYYPSSNYKAFAWQAGVFVQKEIGKRSLISVGLNYALYQTKITTGSYVYVSNVQASNSNFYANVRTGNGVAGGIDYHSRLQYAELPVNYSVRLNRNKQSPFYWNGGISAGLLMASNYLHYDTAVNGIYFKDNSLLRKTLVNLQTGFGFSVFSNTKTPVTIGPSVQFSLINLLKQDAEKRFVLFGGVKMQMLLSGRNKK